MTEDPLKANVYNVHKYKVGEDIFAYDIDDLLKTWDYHSRTKNFTDLIYIMDDKNVSSYVTHIWVHVYGVSKIPTIPENKTAATSNLFKRYITPAKIINTYLLIIAPNEGYCGDNSFENHLKKNKKLCYFASKFNHIIQCFGDLSNPNKLISVGLVTLDPSDIPDFKDIPENEQFNMHEPSIADTLLNKDINGIKFLVKKGDVINNIQANILVNNAGDGYGEGGGICGAIWKAYGSDKHDLSTEINKSKDEFENGCKSMDLNNKIIEMRGSRTIMKDDIQEKASMNNTLSYSYDYVLHMIGPNCRISPYNTDINKAFTQLHHCIYTCLLGDQIFNKSFQKIKMRNSIDLKNLSIVITPMSAGLYGCDKQKCCETIISAAVDYAYHAKVRNIKTILFVDIDAGCTFFSNAIKKIDTSHPASKVYWPYNEGMGGYYNDWNITPSPFIYSYIYVIVFIIFIIVHTCRRITSRVTYINSLVN